MRTGQIADQAGVDVQTLRYYERRGILPPPARRDSGYREYSSEAVRVVRFVKRAQELGGDAASPCRGGGSAALAWCAWDTLFLPERLGTTLQVRSVDPVSNTAIELRVAPDRVESVEPAG